ncbi:MAG TPA: hypothetical protein VF255_08225 [Solirubrobacterales bacterium]
MYGRIIGVVAVLVMGAALVAGCGDDGEASSGVTKAEFTKEAEAVCNERQEACETEGESFVKRNEEADPVTNKEAVERSKAFFRTAALPLFEEELTALEELEVPEADEAQVEKMLQSRSRGVEKLDEGGLEAMLGEPFEEFEKEAKAYGLNCTPFA